MKFKKDESSHLEIPMQFEAPPMPVIPRACGKIDGMIATAYTKGKADAQEEFKQECDKCIFVFRKDKVEEIKKQGMADGAREFIAWVCDKGYYMSNEDPDAPSMTINELIEVWEKEHKE